MAYHVRTGKTTTAHFETIADGKLRASVDIRRPRSEQLLRRTTRTISEDGSVRYRGQTLIPRVSSFHGTLTIFEAPDGTLSV